MRGKKYLIIFLSVVIILSFSIVSFAEDYEDEGYNVHLKYPDGWIVDTDPPQPDISVSFYPKNSTSTLIAMTFKNFENGEDFRNYSDKDFEEYDDEIISGFNTDDMIEMMGKATITSQKIKRSNGLVYIQTSIVVPDREIIMTMLTTIIDGIYYNLTISTTYEDAKKYDKEFSDALISFSYNGNISSPQKT